MVPNLSRNKEDSRWMMLSLLTVIPRFLYNRVWLAKNIGAEESKVQEAAVQVLKETGNLKGEIPKEFHWSISSLSGLGTLSKYAAFAATSVLFGESGVCGYLWEGLSWTTKLALSLGVAHLASHYLKGGSYGSQATNTNTNTNTVHINLVGMDPKLIIREEKRDGIVSVTVQQEPKAPVSPLENPSKAAG